MGYFNEMYGKSEEELSDAKKPLIEKKVKRGFESAVCSLEEELIDCDESIRESRQLIANGNVEYIQYVVEKLIEKEEIQLQIDMINHEKELFFD